MTFLFSLFLFCLSLPLCVSVSLRFCLSLLCITLLSVPLSMCPSVFGCLSRLSASTTYSSVSNYDTDSKPGSGGCISYIIYVQAFSCKPTSNYPCHVFRIVRLGFVSDCGALGVTLCRVVYQVKYSVPRSCHLLPK